ncbi:MAG TPA: 4-hydroxy-3-methylbut-2-enyl diphosphate reductase [Puia sp.]
MKTFQVPNAYRSPLITAIKNKRRAEDKMKKDFSPVLLDFGSLHIFLARHFGFCYGVEHAIDIAFRIVDENPGKNIFLLSEMIHNPRVNEDLENRGVRFLQDTRGKQLIPFDSLQKDDIVITPAFGTSLEIDAQLKFRGIHTEKYNTTCPFVEKVWNRSGQISEKKFTVIIHGKPGHEETRATFSHATAGGPALVIRDLKEAHVLGHFIKKEKSAPDFFEIFGDRVSPGFDPATDLEKIGVVNQTTMLASETQQIADFLKQSISERSLLTNENVSDQFADTRDTLCYATNDNQSAVSGMLSTPAHLAIVVGGYKSSNTSHLAELCEEQLPAYFIEGPDKIISEEKISHFDLEKHQEKTTIGWLPANRPLRLLLTSGASCPDAIVESVIGKICGLIKGCRPLEDLISEFDLTAES